MNAISVLHILFFYVSDHARQYGELRTRFKYNKSYFETAEATRHE